MILVTGASGSVGRRVVRLLRADGREVRAMVRRPGDCGPFEAMAVPALVGDIRRAVDRAAALLGVDEVIACHSAYHDYVHQDIATVDGQATVDLIGDCVANGVRHFTLLSHHHADRPSHSARLTAKRAAELALLGQNSMFYTILRLAPLMDELTRLPGLNSTGAGRHLILFGDGRARLAPLSPLDAARVAAQCARVEAARNETLTVGGPEIYTWLELGTLLERAWDERVQTWRLPLFLLTAARWVLGWLKPRVGERLAWLETLYTTDFASDPSRIAAIFSLGPEDLETFLSRDEAEETLAGLSVDTAPARAVEPAAPPTDVSEPEPPSRATEQPHHRVVTLDEEPERALEAPAARPWPAPEPAAEEWPAPAVEPLPAPEPLPAEEPVLEVEPPAEPEPAEVEPAPIASDPMLPESEALPEPEEILPEPLGLDEVSAEAPVVESQAIPPEPLPTPAPVDDPEVLPPAEDDAPDVAPALPPEDDAPEVAEPAAALPPDDEAGEQDPAEADAEPWGRHGDFDREPALPVDPEQRRPRVTRPQHTDATVVDLDEE